MSGCCAPRFHRTSCQIIVDRFRRNLLCFLYLASYDSRRQPLWYRGFSRIARHGVRSGKRTFVNQLDWRLSVGRWGQCRQSRATGSARATGSVLPNGHELGCRRRRRRVQCRQSDRGPSVVWWRGRVPRVGHVLEQFCLGRADCTSSLESELDGVQLNSPADRLVAHDRGRRGQCYQTDTSSSVEAGNSMQGNGVSATKRTRARLEAGTGSGPANAGNGVSATKRTRTRLPVARHAFIALRAKLLSTDFVRIYSAFSIWRRMILGVSHFGIVALAELRS